MAMIKFNHVSKIYENGHVALGDVSVEIDRGEFVFLVGPSGAGKSTFIRLLLRELKANKGKIYIADKDITRLSQRKIPYLRRGIGCVFQDFKLLPAKTVFENVAFALEVLDKPNYIIQTSVPEVLKIVGLESKSNNYPDELSGGEQQRVSIARAFVNRPPLLLADEPTGNIDPSTAASIMALLNRINRLGTTILMATHNKEIVDSMRKRVIVIEGGKIIRDQMRGVYGHET